MAEYIEREAAYEKCGWYNTVNGKSVCAVRKDELAAIPAADVAPVVQGVWKVGYTDKENKTTGVECSECGAFYELDLFDFGLCYNYCPNCGARMDGDGNG